MFILYLLPEVLDPTSVACADCSMTQCLTRPHLGLQGQLGQGVMLSRSSEVVSPKIIRVPSSMVLHGPPWSPMVLHGPPWSPMVPHGPPWSRVLNAGLPGTGQDPSPLRVASRCLRWTCWPVQRSQPSQKGCCCHSGSRPVYSSAPHHVKVAT